MQPRFSWPLEELGLRFSAGRRLQTHDDINLRRTSEPWIALGRDFGSRRAFPSSHAKTWHRVSLLDRTINVWWRLLTDTGLWSDDVIVSRSLIFA